VYDRPTQTIHLFERGDRRKKITAKILPFPSSNNNNNNQHHQEHELVKELIGVSLYDQLCEDIEVLDALLPLSAVTSTSLIRHQQSLLGGGGEGTTSSDNNEVSKV
jgi:hypothetical protein